MKVNIRTITQIKNGYVLTIGEIPPRKRSNIFRDGKLFSRKTEAPNYDGMPNMALQSVRPLTRYEKSKILQNEPV